MADARDCVFDWDACRDHRRAPVCILTLSGCARCSPMWAVHVTRQEMLSMLEGQGEDPRALVTL